MIEQESSLEKFGATCLRGAEAPRSGRHLEKRRGHGTPTIAPSRPLPPRAGLAAPPWQCSPCSNRGGTASGTRATSRDVDATTSGAGCCDITQPSERSTNTWGVGPGAGPTTTLDRPPLGRNHHQQGSRRLRDPWRRGSPVPLVGIACSWRLCDHCCHDLLLSRPRSRSRGVRWLDCRHHACCRPWHSLCVTPCHQRHPQLERLDRRKGGDCRRRPDGKEKDRR
jgi:hypothetical protein